MKKKRSKIPHLVSQSRLYPLGTPVVFTDGSYLFETFAKEYITHKKGLFIMAPSGSGKTYYINSQKDKHWIDGDNLWKSAHAHPKDGWWLQDDEFMNEIDRRSDLITEQAKRLGFWIMGASNFWLKPDAIVIPDWSTHKKYIEQREKTNYDGGATSDRLNQVIAHREWIMRWTKKGVPMFKSVQEAVDYLTKGIK